MVKLSTEDSPIPPVPPIPPIDELETKRRDRRSRRRKEKIKSYASLASFIFYLGFVIVWLFFFAGPTGFNLGPFENLGIMLGVLFLIFGFLGVMWTPKDVGPSPWRVHFSIITAILWIVFIVLWLPFADRILIDQNTLAKNLAVIIGSTTLFLGVNMGAWVTWLPSDVGAGRRPLGTVGLLAFWLGFIVYWLWFQADALVWNVNSVYLLLSTMVFFAITLGIWIPFFRKEGEIQGYFGFGLLFAWLLIMIVWYQFFAVDFTDYQNLAVFLASFLGVIAIGAVKGWNDYRSKRVDSFDWND